MNSGELLRAQRQRRRAEVALRIILGATLQEAAAYAGVVSRERARQMLLRSLHDARKQGLLDSHGHYTLRQLDELRNDPKVVTALRAIASDVARSGQKGDDDAHSRRF